MMRRIIALVLATAMLCGAMTVYAADDTVALSSKNVLVLDDIPVTDFVSGVSPYDGTASVLTESEAEAAGAPSGYSGTVTRVGPGSNSSYAGVTIDPTALGIPVSEIESITFRVYLKGGTSLRISNKGASSWAVLANVSSNTWVDYTIKSDGTGLSGGVSLNYFADSNQNLGVFGIGAKSVSYLYIDSITLELSDNYSVGDKDMKPPVINYLGETTVKLNEGEIFTPGSVTAYDEYDGENAAIDYEWSDGAVDSQGRLKVGVHIFMIKATDKSGNTSTLKITVQVKGYDPYSVVVDKLPVTDYIEGVSPYDGIVTEYTQAQADAAGLPAGYEGNVIKVVGGGYTGVTFDMSSLNIPIGAVKSITFRVYFTSGASSFRISKSGYSNWIALSDISSEKWVDYVLDINGRGFSTGKGLSDLADKNGYLGVFGLGTKNGSGIYVDSIVIGLKEDDKRAPVLSYDGETDIFTSAGKPFLHGVTAYDELEDRNVDTSVEWSAGAIDSDGNLKEGTHTCVVSASDYYGNKSSVTFNLTVGAPDTEAPEIQFEASEIYVPIGTFYRMVVSCVDNYDKVKVAEQWSVGALDPAGRLTEGTHTLTLTATDLSGNTATHVVTVYVTSGDEVVGDLILCK